MKAKKLTIEDTAIFCISTEKRNIFHFSKHFDIFLGVQHNIQTSLSDK